LTYRYIKLGQQVQRARAYLLKEPPLDCSDRRLNACLVAWLVWSSGKYRKSTMVSEVAIRRIDVGVITVRPFYSGLQIVDHDVLTHSTKVAPHFLVRFDE